MQKQNIFKPKMNSNNMKKEGAEVIGVFSNKSLKKIVLYNNSTSLLNGEVTLKW